MEFSRVVLAGVDAGHVPSAATTLRSVPEEDEALLRERSLLHVAASRARDALVVTWSGKRSVVGCECGLAPASTTKNEGYEWHSLDHSSLGRAAAGRHCRRLTRRTSSWTTRIAERFSRSLPTGLTCGSPGPSRVR
nr:3'-5' exonuclease [Gordonia terrae]